MKINKLVLFAILHIPLAMIMSMSSTIATVHGLLTLAIGLHFALKGKPERVLYIISYIAGAEIFWRMNRADVLWEYGKYASAIIMLCYIARSKKTRRPGSGRFIAFAYFAVMLPSVVATFDESMAPFQDLSFNLSGPLSLMISVMFLYCLEITPDAIRKIGLFFMAPVLGIAAIASKGTFLSEDTIVFGEQSMFQTSGGFGPNQISAVLGLAALFSLAFIVLSRGRMVRTVVVGMFFWLLIQTFLTFSRGGIYNLVFAIFIGVYHLIKDRKTRMSVVVLGIALVVVLQFLIFPFLDSFTEGAFGTRFKSIDTTAREKIAAADYQIWLDNPLMGVGAGLSKYYHRDIVGRVVASHTEFTRLLAEHGIFGIASIMFLFIMAVQSYRRSRGPLARGIVLMCVGWTMLEMSHSAMRIYAISFMFGLSQAKYTDIQPDRNLGLKNAGSAFPGKTIEPADRIGFRRLPGKQSVNYPTRRQY